ncbi:hypothetical protein BDV96DRAFT_649414 [Lophiotrema nucula]|uniref:Uncharacterized protein n=1 Tax=Lophiotrema nucula TaxID=690887 RepID=A0A6A5YY30_9PLEO|nr:hypothetical protein BDV96DRAFT_649414 [Lophiotrema nucula]
MDTWRLPRSFLYLLSTRRACFSTFATESDDEGRIHRRAHVFQTTDLSSHTFSFALTQDPETDTISIFLYGLVASEFELLFEELKMSSQLLSIPTFLPLLLLDMKAEAIDRELHSCHNDIHNIKIATGMTKRDVPKPKEDYGFVETSRLLTRLTATLATCGLAVAGHLSLLDAIEKETKEFNNALSEKRQCVNSNSTKKIMQRIDFLRDWLEALEPRTKCLSQRSQAYVQTIYSLMAQKDNALNIQTAEASLRISEASYRDSLSMKAIAEATSRDTCLMVILAILTSIFLPATFTATLFSTTFFDFKSLDKDAIVSERFWVYWVVTVALTVLTVGSAGYFWRVRERKIVMRFRRLGEDGERVESGSKDEVVEGK